MKYNGKWTKIGYVMPDRFVLINNEALKKYFKMLVSVIFYFPMLTLRKNHELSIRGWIYAYVMPDRFAKSIINPQNWI